ELKPLRPSQGGPSMRGILTAVVLFAVYGPAAAQKRMPHNMLEHHVQDLERRVAILEAEFSTHQIPASPQTPAGFYQYQQPVTYYYPQQFGGYGYGTFSGAGDVVCGPNGCGPAQGRRAILP